MCIYIKNTVMWYLFLWETRSKAVPSNVEANDAHRRRGGGLWTTIMSISEQINQLGPRLSDAIWSHGSGATFGSDNNLLLGTNIDCDHQWSFFGSHGNFTGNASDIFRWYEFDNYFSLQPHLSGANWLTEIKQDIALSICMQGVTFQHPRDMWQIEWAVTHVFSGYHH